MSAMKEWIIALILAAIIVYVVRRLTGKGGK